jgi:hypothetical protein
LDASGSKTSAWSNCWAGGQVRGVAGELVEVGQHLVHAAELGVEHVLPLGAA